MTQEEAEANDKGDKWVFYQAKKTPFTSGLGTWEEKIHEKHLQKGLLH